LLFIASAPVAPEHFREGMVVKKAKRREWTAQDVRELKTLARQKTPAGKIARKLKRTEGATRQKALTLNVSLNSRPTKRKAPK
jgi:putative SOS response-associated peptidase YedK